MFTFPVGFMTGSTKKVLSASLIVNAMNPASFNLASARADRYVILAYNHDVGGLPSGITLGGGAAVLLASGAVTHVGIGGDSWDQRISLWGRKITGSGTIAISVSDGSIYADIAIIDVVGSDQTALSASGLAGASYNIPAGGLGIYATQPPEVSYAWSGTWTGATPIATPSGGSVAKKETAAALSGYAVSASPAPRGDVAIIMKPQ